MPETNNNKSEIGAAEYSGEMTAANKKMSTSYEQKNDHCKDGAAEQHKHEDSIKSSSDNIDDIDYMDEMNAVRKIFDKVGISSDDYDDKLFQDPPQKKKCPICMLPIMPHANALCGVRCAYQPCCGKTVCLGCMAAAGEEMSKGTLKPCCPFCRESINKQEKVHEEDKNE